MPAAINTRGVTMNYIVSMEAGTDSVDQGPLRQIPRVQIRHLAVGRFMNMKLLSKTFKDLLHLCSGLHFRCKSVFLK